MKKILMIIAFRNFRDEEYFIPTDIFIKNGFEVITASSKKGLAIGALGGEVEVDIIPEEVKVKDYKAVVLVGGQGALKELDKGIYYTIIKEAEKLKVVVGGICIAPVILAKAGVLKGRTATVYSSNMENRGVNILKEEGVKVSKEGVVSDGLFVTASGPEEAEKFSEKIIKVISYE